MDKTQSGKQINVGYNSPSEMAEDAVVILAEMVGELKAVIAISCVASRFSPPSFSQTPRNSSPSTQIWMRRIAIATIASILYRYREFHQKMLQPFGCQTPLSKALFDKIPRAKMHDLRQVTQHVIDKKTRKHHSVMKVLESFNAINEEYKSLLGDDAIGLLRHLENIRSELLVRFPEARSSFQKRYRSGAIAQSERLETNRPIR